MIDHGPVAPMLLVEDSDEDYQIFARALGRPPVAPLSRVRTGAEALDFLHRQGRFAASGAAPRPRLIVLDLNLPGINGREVLTRVKGDANLRAIPVIVLTTSTNPRDMDQCYRDGACGYIVKVLDAPRYIAMVQTLTTYWYDIVVLPDERGDR